MGFDSRTIQSVTRSRKIESKSRHNRTNETTQASLRAAHFDADLAFLCKELDRVSKAEAVRPLATVPVTRHLGCVHMFGVLWGVLAPLVCVCVHVALTGRSPKAKQTNSAHIDIYQGAPPPAQAGRQGARRSQGVHRAAPPGVGRRPAAGPEQAAHPGAGAGALPFPYHHGRRRRGEGLMGVRGWFGECFDRCLGKIKMHMTERRKTK